MKNNVDGELENWERRSMDGDFSLVPRPFRWSQSARFAHFLNGYKEAGGLDELARLRQRVASDALVSGGHWTGSARDLWLCLYFEHRAARHTGTDGDESSLNELCEELRRALQKLSPREAVDLASCLEST